MDLEQKFFDVKHRALPREESDLASQRSKPSKRRWYRHFLFVVSLLATVAFLFTCSPSSVPLLRPIGVTTTTGRCQQTSPLALKHQSKEILNMDIYLESEAFRNISITRLSKAVQIPTESFDDLGSLTGDKRWDIMYDFASYLNEAFPTVHQLLSVEKINTHGLLYTWQGSDETLKPTLLMAHQDVVPVPKSTMDAWTHPPFGGFYDGTYIWGRGASDCKNQLIGALEAVEELLKAGFKPRRTILLSFGFDEEISGNEGAGHLAPYILKRYGQDGIASIVDEGSGFSKAWGMRMALPGVAEKGYIDVNITVRMPGGHSSIPPAHTSIGVMGELISLIEANPYSPHLADENPYIDLLACGAEYADSFPTKIKKLLNHRLKSRHHKSCRQRTTKDREDPLATEVAKSSLATRYLMQTSIAADVISGGVKVNALPERTTAIINHRINIGETPHDIEKKIGRLAKQVANRHNLTLHAFDGVKEEASSISLVAITVLPVAPVTPTTFSLDKDADKVTPYSLLASTTRLLYGTDVIVAPGLMTGNTDTRYYWNVSRHIFRYSAGWDGESSGLGNIHTVDERISVAAHVNMVRWLSLWVRGMDGAILS